MPGAADPRAELDRILPKFDHAPFPSSGFNAVSIPFRYEDPDNVGDRFEADALAFMLSDAIDWAPGSYSARHAYFVFAKTGAPVDFTANYRPHAISNTIGDWHATHAIGGVLTRTQQGCTGILEIYDTKGIKVFEKKFAETRDYFDLLGDMAAASITFFSAPPSPVLFQHLHDRPCQKIESIVRLGSAAFLPRRRSLPVFTKIVNDDPGFAEVRFWLANQNSWALQNGFPTEKQISQSLSDRITVSALEAFSPELSHDPESVRLFPDQVKQAKDWVGADFPAVLTAGLACDQFITGYNDQRIKDALAAAARFPNSYRLLTALAQQLTHNKDGPVDSETAAAIALVAARDRYTPGVGDKRVALQFLADNLFLLARPELAASVISKSNDISPYWLWRLCCAYNQCARFEDTIKAFQSANNQNQDQFMALAAGETLLAAATIGDTATVQKLKLEWATEFSINGTSKMFDFMNDALLGKTVPGNGAVQILMDHQTQLSHDLLIVMGAQAEIAFHQRNLSGDLWQLMVYEPGNRRYWLLLDAYERQHPTEEGGQFYESLDWLEHDDPWVQRVVAEWKGRRDSETPDPLMSVYSFPDVLNDFDPVQIPHRSTPPPMDLNRKVQFSATPWAAAHAVHDLLNANKRTEAHALALRFQNIAVQTSREGIRAWAAHLVHLTDNAPVK